MKHYEKYTYSKPSRNTRFLQPFHMVQMSKYQFEKYSMSPNTVNLGEKWMQVVIYLGGKNGETEEKVWKIFNL